MKEKKLRPKQSIFVNEYLVDFNATAAAIRAGYSKKRADATAYNLLRKAEIQSFLKKQIEERKDRLEIKVDRVLQEQARIAFYNIFDLFNKDGSMKDFSEIDEDVAAAIRNIDVVVVESKGTKKVFIKKIRMQDKNKALDSLSKHLGLYQKDNEQQGNADLKTKQEFMESLLKSISQSDRSLPLKP